MSKKNLEAPHEQPDVEEYPELAENVDENGVEFNDTNQVEVINISGHNVKFDIDGNRYLLKPGQTTRLHKAYALPRSMAAERDPLPSVVEMLTSKKVLAITDPRAKGRSR